MIERLRRALEHVEELSPEAQEELAEIIEEQTEPLDDAPATPEQGLRPGEERLPPRTRQALAAFDSARDVQDDATYPASTGAAISSVTAGTGTGTPIVPVRRARV